MPIRASERARYPKDWHTITLRIRERAKERCECEGECRIRHGRFDTWGRCVERNREPARFFKGKVVLTVAHMDHTPENCDEDNLMAMCQRCHLRYDHKHHMKNARETREKKKGPLLPFGSEATNG